MGDDIRLIHGACEDVLAGLPAESVDSVVTDPPYGLRYFGRKWDYDVPTVAQWEACLRVLKPGGHLLSFAGTRTQHRMAVRIEDAGFEIRDIVAWVYGSGMPKSLDISKAIDRVRDDSGDILRVTSFMAEAAARMSVSRADADEHMGTSDMGGWWLSRLRHRCQCPRWDQWLRLKTLLGLSDEMDAEVWRLNGRKGKPGEAWDRREVVGSGHRKATGRMAQGDGGYAFGEDFNITAPATDSARRWSGWGTALRPSFEPITVARKPPVGPIAENVQRHGTGALNIDGCRIPSDDGDEPRWPANFIHDGSDEAAAALGHAARYFYCAKASRADRGPGNDWPTVKPTDLMRYLVRLVTPPGGLVLDPWMGSGSTGKAAVLEGFRFLGIDRDEHAFEIASKRVEGAKLSRCEPGPVRPAAPVRPGPKAARRDDAPMFAFADDEADAAT